MTLSLSRNIYFLALLTGCRKPCSITPNFRNAPQCSSVREIGNMVPHYENAKEGTAVKKMESMDPVSVISIIAIIIIRCGVSPGALLVV